MEEETINFASDWIRRFHERRHSKDFQSSPLRNWDDGDTFTEASWDCRQELHFGQTNFASSCFYSEKALMLSAQTNFDI